MEQEIRPEGPIPARIVIVGEAPGEQEVKEGRPFVGPSGRILDGLLRDVGIPREQCFITNVVLWRPDYEFIEFYKQPRAEAYNASVRRLSDSITNANPNIVVLLGEHALRAVTGKHGVTNWRGSTIPGCTGHKCLPTFHPAAIAREWSFRAASLIDFQRVLTESAFPEIRQTQRRYWIRGEESSTGSEIHAGSEESCGSDQSSSSGLTGGIREDGARGCGSTHSLSTGTEKSRLAHSTIDNIRILKESPYVSFDIETEANQITAIALSPSNRPNWAICIPFWFGGSGSLWTPEEEVSLWEALKDLLTHSGTGKIAHNGLFDIETIERQMGFRVFPYVFDTMIGMHTLYLELPKSLAFAVSVYTDHPYYKADLHSKDMDTFFRYNATDACLTMELATKLTQELKEEGLWEFYQDYAHSLVDPVLAMQLKGVNFDYLRRNSIKKRFQEEVAVLQKNLDAAVGRPININSPKQMKEWLYAELKYKVKTKRSKGQDKETITTNEEALETLFQETQDERLRTVLRIREKQKVISTFLDMRLDEDKRIRCSYNITGTETGRLSSSATTRGTGGNLQNIPSGGVRSLFLADPGYTLINADLSQAEARVVAYIAHESRLIRVFEEGGDIHRKNAATIFKTDESLITDEQRQLAKRVVHASNYGMGPITFSKQCGIPAAEAKRLLNQYFATYPQIANWQLDIAAQLRKNRTLKNPFGRKRVFFNRFNEGLVKEGLAFIPQSTVADIVGQSMVCAHQKGIEILLQVHDSLLVQCKEDMVVQTMQVLHECMDRPVEINGKILRIPVDMKVGKDWDKMIKLG